MINYCIIIINLSNQKKSMFLRLDRHLVKKYKHTLVVRTISQDKIPSSQPKLPPTIRFKDFRSTKNKNLNKNQQKQSKFTIFNPRLSLKKYRERESFSQDKHHQKNIQKELICLNSTIGYFNKNQIINKREESTSFRSRKNININSFVQSEIGPLKYQYSIKFGETKGENKLALKDEEINFQAKMIQSARTEASHTPISHLQHHSKSKNIRTLRDGKINHLIASILSKPQLEKTKSKI